MSDNFHFGPYFNESYIEEKCKGKGYKDTDECGANECNEDKLGDIHKQQKIKKKELTNKIKKDYKKAGKKVKDKLGLKELDEFRFGPAFDEAAYDGSDVNNDPCPCDPTLDDIVNSGDDEISSFRFGPAFNMTNDIFHQMANKR